jgi:CHAT domain-containing protein
MINACSSSLPYLGLMQRDSFSHRFVMSQACAFVGTLWPVDEDVANEFAALFYAALRQKPIGQALLAAKRALLYESANGVTGATLLTRQLAARAYCLFANPDFRIV